MRYFCTYFDHLYLTRGLAMFRSLKRHCPTARLWVLCLSEECYRTLTKLAFEDLLLIRLEDFEAGNAALVAAKANRSRVEYYFTCSPALPLYILDHYQTVELITYLDSDLFFYSNPECLFRELGSGSIGIIKHRPTSDLLETEQFGIYNVAWVSFRRDEAALECLRWWRDRCLEWCYRRLEGNRYADQKYLDEFPKRFRNVIVLENIGANLAPWNIAGYRVTSHGDQINVNETPLVFFHFQGFFEVTRHCYDTGLKVYHVQLSRKTLRSIFEPYIRLLRFLAPDGIGEGLVHMPNRTGPFSKRLLRPIRYLPRTLLMLIRGQRILWVFGRVI
jgi:hypothetical protein